MILNMSGAGAPGKVVTVHVTPGTGAAVTCTNGKKTCTGTTDSSGNAVFKLTKGQWTITAELQGISKSVQADVTGDSTVNISLEQIPAFTYTGSYKIVDDNDTAITSTVGNWKIRFLTSGTLKFTSLNGAENGIDVFLVGGGGGGYRRNGGGGGYTTAQRGVSVTAGTDYPILVGAGGTAAANGGTSSAFSLEAAGGNHGGVSGSYTRVGGNGGSGGGAGSDSGDAAGAGGSDGGNGGNGSGTGGSGQGTTTREFAETSGTLYAGGGGGGGSGSAAGGSGGAGGGGNGSAENGPVAAANGEANTGGGGGGALESSSGSTGGSGIVIIRNKR